MKIAPCRLRELIDATWPAAGFHRVGPWTLREGRGGGKRVSSASAEGPVTDEDIELAERGMTDLGQPPLFTISDGQDALGLMLAARGYEVIDPVVVRACPVVRLIDIAMPPVTVFPIWEPLAIMRDIWGQGGIGPARQAVMDRVAGPKTGLLARYNNKPGGAAFVAVHDRVAMLHALEILPHQRAQGLGKWMVRGAAFWAAKQGAETMAVVCTRANTGANALYASLGMEVVGEYHYCHLTIRKDLL